MPTIPPTTAQARLDEIQRLYREWTELLPKLEAAQQDWQRGADIMQALAHFYFDGEFNAYCDALENGLDLNLHTDGEHSVLSEDTLWNALHEQQQLAWQRLRSAVAVLDPEAKQTA